MLPIQIYELGSVSDNELTRVVCVCRYQGKYVFSYNKKRNGWEIPGGHIEEGETWEDACKREMYEETGATRIKVEPICLYKISTYGLLCYCEILELGKLPNEYEMDKIQLSDALPEPLTFPEAFQLYFNTVKKKKDL